MKLITECYSTISHAICMTGKDRLLEEFSARFQRMINEKGWSSERREDIGKRLGVSGPAVTYWFNGNRMPTITQAIMLSKHFNCCTEWLLTGNGPIRPIAETPDLIDISLLPPQEKANYKALINTRVQQIRETQEQYHALTTEQNKIA
ncbi:helix-turn-helix transcriptional regulator [Methylomonas sp. AM2-LC]|uniref:helix-turn-helix domain-containing protein n=1 Tax=Methylomonas sp. AM2-LC TaxID=3153301 RepID=UPI003266F958